MESSNGISHDYNKKVRVLQQQSKHKMMNDTKL